MAINSSNTSVTVLPSALTPVTSTGRGGVVSGATVSVAAALFVAASPASMAARYFLPVSASVKTGVLNVVPLAPEIFVNVDEPDGAVCH